MFINGLENGCVWIGLGSINSGNFGGWLCFLAVMNRQMPKVFDMTFVRAIFKMIIAGTTGVVCYIAVLIMPLLSLSFFTALFRNSLSFQ